MDHWQVNRFLSDKEKEGASNKTIIHYEGSIRPFFHWLISTHRQFENTHIDDFSVSDLTAEHVSEYERYLLKRVRRNNLSRKTTSDAMYELCAFLRYLYQKGYILHDVTVDIKPIKQGDTYHYRDIPSVKELQHFFTIVDIYSDDPIREKLCFGLMLHLGLRLKEVANLKWDSINLSTSTVSLVRKGNKPSKMYIPKIVMGYIRKLKKQDEEDGVYIFGKTGAYEKIYKSYKIYALLARWDFQGGCHLFRHTYLTYLS
jgi:integrase/recombinase XerD